MDLQQKEKIQESLFNCDAIHINGMDVQSFSYSNETVSFYWESNNCEYGTGIELHELALILKGVKSVKVTDITGAEWHIELLHYATGSVIPDDGYPINVLDDGTTWGNLGHVAFLNEEQLSQTSDGELADITGDYKTVEVEALLNTAKSLQKAHVFDSSEFDMICEIARLALADASFYNDVADMMDTADSELKDLQEKIEKHTNGLS